MRWDGWWGGVVWWLKVPVTSPDKCRVVDVHVSLCWTNKATWYQRGPPLYDGMRWEERESKRERERERVSTHACVAQECEGERVRPAVRQLLRQQHLPSPLNTYTSMYVTFLSSSLCPWVALNHNTHCSMPATFIGILHSQSQQIPFIWSFLLNYTCPTQHHSYPHGWPRPSSQLFRLYALAQEIPGMFYITKTCPSSLHKCLWYLCFLHLVFLSHPHISEY